MYERDYSISIIRFISMIFIILCHFFQYYNNGIAWWLNVGVQMFLFISGYLYGKKNIGNSFGFIIKNLIKIIIPYYILLFLIIIIYSLFFKTEISFLLIIRMIFTIGVIKGGEHLWFLRYIIFCYIITPLLKKILKIIGKKVTISDVIIPLIAVLFILFFIGYKVPVELSYIICYIIGLVYGELVNYKKNTKILSFFIVLLAIVCNCIHIYLDSFSNISLLGRCYNIFCAYSHLLLGISLVILFKLIIMNLCNNYYNAYIKKICDFSDNYSYNIYLVHQFLILGPLSLMEILPIYYNCLIIIMVVIIIAFLNNYFSRMTIKIISNNKCYKKIVR